MYAEEQGEVFLGRSQAQAKSMSDDTAKAIDSEVRDFVDRNYQRAEQILKDNMDILHSMKDALMKYETIDAKQIDDLMARREVGEPKDWSNQNNKDAGGSDKPKSGSSSKADKAEDQDNSEKTVTDVEPEDKPAS